MSDWFFKLYILDFVGERTMGFCQRIMSLFYPKSPNPRNEEVEEDYEFENPFFGNHVSKCYPGYVSNHAPSYAIREKRPFANKKGFYNMYVVHSGYDGQVEG